MPTPRRTKKSRAREIVHSEDFTSDVDRLIEYARQRGDELRAHRGLEVRETSFNSEFLADQLRELLEDEFLPVYPDDQEFVDSEFHREVTKKALVGLRMAALKSIAAKRDLDLRGNSEDLAERIARAYKYDDREIAQLVLDNTEEPDAERGYESRVFPLRRPVNIDTAESALRPVTSRLIRTGVARWFAVDDLERSDDVLRLEGRVRSYRAFVQELGDEATLKSAPADDKPLQVELFQGEKAVTVHGAGAYPARTTARAISAVIQVPQTAGLPIHKSRPGRLGLFDDQTVLLLDIFHNRLPAIGATDRNLTIARFVVDRAAADSPTSPAEAKEHSLKAVRFEGNHLLESPQACHLIAVQGRGLVNLSMWIAMPDLVDDRDEAPWFPVRLNVERDSVGVLTGYGRNQPTLAQEVHLLLLEQLEAALDGVADEEALEEFADGIYDIAMGEEADEDQAE